MRQNTLEMHMISHRRNDEYEEMKALFTFPIHPRAEDKENKRRILSLLLKKKKKYWSVYSTVIRRKISNWWMNIQNFSVENNKCFTTRRVFGSRNHKRRHFNFPPSAAATHGLSAQYFMRPRKTHRKGVSSCLHL